MSPGTEQLIRDYLTRLSGAARGRLDPVDRRALVHRTRDFIERKATLTRPETTMDFARLLSELGEPSDLVDQEVRKLAALRDDMPPTRRSSVRIARALRHDSDGQSRHWPLQRTRSGDGESNGSSHSDEPAADLAAQPDNRDADTKERRLVGLVNLIPLHPNPQDHEARLFGRSRSHVPASPEPEPEDQPAEPEDQPAEPEAVSADAHGAIAADTSTASAPGHLPDSAYPTKFADGVQADVEAAEVDSTSLTNVPRGWGSSTTAAPSNATAEADSVAQVERPAGPDALRSAPAPEALPSDPASAAESEPGTAVAESSTAVAESTTAAAESSTAEAGPSTAQAGPSTAEAGPSTAEAGPSTAVAESSTAKAESSTGAAATPKTRAAGAWTGLLSASAQAAEVAPTVETSTSPARPGAVASLEKLRAGSVKATGRLITGTFRWCQRCPLEATASLVLGVGGAIFPPIWLLGAALAFGSRLWDYRDRWLGLGGPVLLTIAGPAIAVSVLGGKYTLGHDVHLGWLYADVSARISAVLGTSYLVWRSVHGRRPPTVPPWNKPRRIA